MRAKLSVEDVRRRALRAAAAAAGLSLLSCSDPVASGGVGADATAADSAGQLDAASGVDSVGSDGSASDGAGDAAISDSAGADDAATIDANDGVSAADVASNDAAVTDSAVTDSATPVDTLADTATSDDAADTTAADVADTAGCGDPEPGAPNCLEVLPAMRSQCCMDRSEHCAKAYPGNGDDASICQFGPNFSGQCTGCIPWGPPAPPSFDRAWRPTVLRNGDVFEVV